MMEEAQLSASFQRVAAVGEVKEGRGHAVYLDGVKVALFRRGSRFYAFSDRCPHMGASLSEGRLTLRGLRCHWHGWQFDPDSGRCRQKSWARVRVYQVKVEDGALFLRPVPEPDREVEPGDEPWMSWEPPVDEPEKK
jgi:nitrite reductase (NADH) small subunit/3-phenylpropionate/trans-cinnamate dioxygenase ferredoxin subunit